MMDNWFGINEGLAAAGRLPALARVRERISAYEIVLLILCGAAAAAASGFIRLGLRLPGHSIILSMIPMALGLALAPRRLSGLIMSASAFGTGAAFNLAGMAHLGPVLYQPVPHRAGDGSGCEQIAQRLEAVFRAGFGWNRHESDGVVLQGR